VLEENSGIFKNKGTSLWNSVLTPDLVGNTFRRSIRCGEIFLYNQHIDRRNVLPTKLEKGGRSERDKLDSGRSTKLTVPPSSDARPLVYRTNREALSTALFRRAGLSATANSCLEHRGPLYLSQRPNV